MTLKDFLEAVTLAKNQRIKLYDSDMKQFMVLNYGKRPDSAKILNSPVIVVTMSGGDTFTVVIGGKHA